MGGEVLSHSKELLVIVGLLSAFAGIVGTWTTMRNQIVELRADFNRLLTRHDHCSATQQERWEEVSRNLAQALHDNKLVNEQTRSEIKVVAQQLMDYIAWRKNGGRQ